MFAFGGETKSFFGWRTSGVVDELDLDNGSSPWHPRPAMPTPRSHLAVAALEDEGPLYTIGGRRKFPFGLFFRKASGGNDAYILRNEWEVPCRMPTARAELGVVALGHRIFAMGGTRSLFWGLLPDARFRATEEYDPHTDSWRKLPSMRLPRWSFVALVIENAIYAFGGRTSRGPACPLASAVLSRFFVFEREPLLNSNQDADD